MGSLALAAAFGVIVVGGLGLWAALALSLGLRQIEADECGVPGCEHGPSLELVASRGGRDG